MDVNLKHFSHEYCPLTLLLSHDDQQHLEKICKWCDDEIVDVPAYYGCSKCPDFFMHKRCAELPTEINHPFHRKHPLFLSPRLSGHDGFDVFYACDACNARLILSHYHCSKCGFYLDHNCASLIPINANHHDDDDDDQLATSSISSTNATTTLTHPVYGISLLVQTEHLLIPCTTNTVTEENKCIFKCRKCFLPIENSIIYVCLKCHFLAHQSCAKFPETILEHPFHPRQCKLVLSKLPSFFKGRRCKACWNHITGCGYYCTSSCDGFLAHQSCAKFQLHIECAFPMLSIEFKIHRHPLAFFSKPIGDFVHCVSGCICSNEECRSGVFRCVPCGTFDFHLHCVPTLPLTFKRDDRHRHALTLTKSPVNHSGYDEEEEYVVTELYCDACEKPRNPECPTYYCAKCHYVAHVLCIISEEDILALREEPRLQVELDEGEVLETSEDNDNLISSLRQFDEAVDEMTIELETLTEKLETRKQELETMKHERDQFISSHPQLRGACLDA